MMTSWFLTFGAMALPIAFALFLVHFGMSDAPVFLYYLGWVVGTLGLCSFVIALRKSSKEDKEKREAIKKSDANFRSVMKTMEAIKGQLESIGSRLDKKR